MEFPPILLINLDNRPDRLEKIQENFRDWPKLEKVSAIRHESGAEGCRLSHLKCLELARQRNYPWVLVLEDDCLVNPDSLERFNNILPSLWIRRESFDVFLGGVTEVRDVSVIQYNPVLFKAIGLTTHFCVYSSNSYDKLIEANKNGGGSPDAVYVGIDNIRIFCTYPFIAIQAPSYSDLLKREVNYKEVFSSSEEILKKYLESEKALEGFLQDSKVFNNKLCIFNVLSVSFLLFIAKLYIEKN